MEVYNIEEFVADVDIESIEEAQQVSKSLRQAEINSFNSSFMDKQAKRLSKPLRVILFLILIFFCRGGGG